MRKVDLAATWGVRVVSYSAYFGSGLLASVHVCAAQSHEVWIERFYCDFDETPLGNAVNPQRGRMAVPQGPGLGVDPDPRVLRKLAVDA
jgi:L-alanine-DL-glutamate epimerase-like enolase superfamily enzyme